MAMIYCRECGKMISDQALSCPHCGCVVSNPNRSERDWLTTLLWSLRDQMMPSYLLVIRYLVTRVGLSTATTSLLSGARLPNSHLLLQYG